MDRSPRDANRSRELRCRHCSNEHTQTNTEESNDADSVEDASELPSVEESTRTAARGRYALRERTTPLNVTCEPLEASFIRGEGNVTD